MNIAILGSGIVGQTIGGALVARGHAVQIGSRSADNPKAAEWVRSAQGRGSHGTFADAAAFGEVVFNCTAGVGSLDALRAAGEENLRDKVLIDIANPLDFSRGMPPSLTICNTASLSERIQQAFPQAKVVKTLNTMNCQVMVDPLRVPGDHNVFLSGNDLTAKEQVADWLGEWFGWKRENVLDLGDITTARGPEMLLPIWIRLMGTLQTPVFNFHVVLGQPAARV